MTGIDWCDGDLYGHRDLQRKLLEESAALRFRWVEVMCKAMGLCCETVWRVPVMGLQRKRRM
jgi:hypothetical protein